MILTVHRCKLNAFNCYISPSSHFPYAEGSEDGGKGNEMMKLTRHTFTSLSSLFSKVFPLVPTLRTIMEKSPLSPTGVTFKSIADAA